jgi:hypothetical protein
LPARFDALRMTVEHYQAIRPPGPEACGLRYLHDYKPNFLCKTSIEVPKVHSWVGSWVGCFGRLAYAPNGERRPRCLSASIRKRLVRGICRGSVTRSNVGRKARLAQPPNPMPHSAASASCIRSPLPFESVCPPYKRLRSYFCNIQRGASPPSVVLNYRGWPRRRPHTPARREDEGEAPEPCRAPKVSRRRKSRRET